MAARSSMLSVYTSLTFLAVYVLIFMSSAFEDIRGPLVVQRLMEAGRGALWNSDQVKGDLLVQLRASVRRHG